MSFATLVIRAMERRDLPEVDRIQSAAPEASQWNPEDYLGYESFVAELGGGVAGFAVARLLPPDEIEVLNIATDPHVRRQGVGSALLASLLRLPGQILFLEVRESNIAALALYARAGFTENGRRKYYYAVLGIPTGSREDAVVMKMQKW
jgi:ribosomal-protein-alanine N-acetyltransferase